MRQENLKVYYQHKNHDNFSRFLSQFYQSYLNVQMKQDKFLGHQHQHATLQPNLHFFKVRLKNRNHLRLSLQIRNPIITGVEISIDVGITDITSKLIDSRERFLRNPSTNWTFFCGPFPFRNTRNCQLLRDRCQISLLILSAFKQIINLYSPRNHQKTIGFLRILEGIEVN